MVNFSVYYDTCLPLPPSARKLAVTANLAETLSNRPFSESRLLIWADAIYFYQEHLAEKLERATSVFFLYRIVMQYASRQKAPSFFA